RLIETASGLRMHSLIARKGLPTTNDRVDIDRVDLEPIAAPARAFGRHDGGSAAQEGIEHNLVPARAIHDRIGHQGNRLHCGMERQQVAFIRTSPEGVGAWIIPYIAAMAPILSELYVVPVRAAAMLEHEHQFVLAAVERSHAGIMFRPDADVLELGIGFFTGCKEFAHMPPVHADEVHGAIDAVTCEEPAGAG